jgi:hypothetical protein
VEEPSELEALGECLMEKTTLRARLTKDLELLGCEWSFWLNERNSSCSCCSLAMMPS